MSLATKADIAFSSDREGIQQIFRTDNDGTAIERLGFLDEDRRAPAISPDARRVAFTTARKSDEVFVLDLAGGFEYQVGTGLWAPSFAPDGEWLACMGANPLLIGGYALYLIRADGTANRRLLTDLWVMGRASWSPDGTRIAFAASIPGYTIMTIRPDGTELTEIYHTRWELGNCSWSPDGSRIAFHSGEGRGSIFAINSDGTDLRLLTNAPGGDGEPAWSPDGNEIAFTSKRDGNLEIYVMNADGSNQRNITNHPADDMWPAWFPDATMPVTSQDKTPLVWAQLKRLP